MRRLCIAVYAACLILFVLMCWSVSCYQYLPGDIAVYDWFSGINSPFFHGLMSGVSFLGETAPAMITVAVIVALLFFGRGRLQAFFTGAVPTAAALSVWLLKLLLDRPRPACVMADNGGLSFPSGHTTYAVAFAGFLFFLLPELVENKNVIKILRIAMLLFIALMITSRLYLCEHWLSDVLGGVLLGGLLVAPAIVLYRRCSEGRQDA